MDKNTLLSQLEALLSAEPDPVANMANTAALLYHGLTGLNWVGFYLLKEGGLVLGPFQGKPACVRICVGRGVCGTAVQLRKTVCVPDVHLFPGHIACDSASQSELVIPLIKNGVILGVLDMDSPHKNYFSQEDRAFFEKAAEILLKNCCF